MRTTSQVGAMPATAALLALVAASAIVINAEAQQGAGGGRPAAAPAPVRVAVQVTEVRPDMVGTYQDLIRNEANPGLKKAGLAYRWTWANGPSGQAYTFVSVQPIADYAQYDQPGLLQKAIGADGVANYNAKLRPAIVSQHTYIETLRQDLSIVSNSGTPPALAVIQTFQVASGKGDDFTKSMTMDYLPNYRKAGLKDFWVYATNYGAPGGQIVTVRPIAKYAELDGMGLLAKAGVTGDAAAQIGARRAAISTVIDNELVRFVPELSFGTPKGPATN
ncbi:MAG TPA: hypothetical protein VGJ39_15755 [Vicinamibacterales bacterium]